MNAIVYEMKCLTNLHAGSGEANYSIIDNEVQRDSVTGYPTIFSSGIKGAIREYFKRHGLSESCAEYIDMFGSEQGDVQNEKKAGTKPGYLKFTQAHLYAFPRRAEAGEAAYQMTTTNTAEKELTDFLSVIGVQDEKKPCEAKVAGEEEFRKLMNHLPVTARNQLQKGISQNLWYEEIVPHETVFWFAVLYDGGAKTDVLTSFDSSLLTDGKAVIQFGADASIGDGICLVKKFCEVKD